MSARKVFTWCANRYVEHIAAFLMVSGLAKTITMQRDKDKLQFIRQYPFSTIIVGSTGTIVSAVAWPISYAFIDKQIYLFGGFPFNLLTIDQWKMRMSTLSLTKRETHLHKMICDYEKSFPESFAEK